MELGFANHAAETTNENNASEYFIEFCFGQFCLKILKAVGGCKNEVNRDYGLVESLLSENVTNIRLNSLFESSQS